MYHYDKKEAYECVRVCMFGASGELIPKWWWKWRYLWKEIPVQIEWERRQKLLDCNTQYRSDSWKRREEKRLDRKYPSDDAILKTLARYLSVPERTLSIIRVLHSSRKAWNRLMAVRGEGGWRAWWKKVKGLSKIVYICVYACVCICI